MPETGSVSDLLAAQSERKLTKMRDGIVADMDRLRIELRLVEDALGRKQRKPRLEAPERRPNGTNNKRSEGDGRFQGLPRKELLAYVAQMNRPVKPADVRDFLTTKGVVRKVEAVRTGLIRLEHDGDLRRDNLGRYVVASNGHGGKVEAELPGRGVSASTVGEDPS